LILQKVGAQPHLDVGADRVGDRAGFLGLLGQVPELFLGEAGDRPPHVEVQGGDPQPLIVERRRGLDGQPFNERPSSAGVCASAIA